MAVTPTPKRTHESDAAWNMMPSSESSDTLVVAVTPLRTRILSLTTLVVVLVVALTLLFYYGVELERFNAKAKSPAQQTKLLDNYNSYSGTIATVFAKPIEQYVAMAVQFIVLRVLTKHLIQAQVNWKLNLLILTFAGGVGYLMGNSLNALNVQLRPQQIRPLVLPGDLSRPSDTVDTANITSLDHTIPENVAKNPLANTLMRNLVLTAAERPPTQCPWSRTTSNTYGDVPDHSLQSGIPRRDWFPQVLPEALTPQALKIRINSTDKSVRSSDLPMNATLAADLVLYSVLYGKWFFPMAKYFDFDVNDVVARYPSLRVTDASQVKQVEGPMAEIFGLLPNTPTDEMTQRDFLLRQSPKLVARQFQDANNYTLLSNISMEFSHVDISPSIHFDAVTMEFEMLPSKLTDVWSRDKTTRYTNLDMLSNCGPWSGLCLVNKVSFPAQNSAKYESMAQVQGMSPCVTDDGTERLWYHFNNTKEGSVIQSRCTQTSNTSMIVFSFAKRLVADALTENIQANTSGMINTTNQAVITNLRKIYSFTVGRLSWTYADLAGTNNAACATQYTTNGRVLACDGLQHPLVGGTQHLVAGVGAVPLDNYVKVEVEREARPNFIPLIEAYEPDPTDVELALGGDVLLPHNIGQITWPNPKQIMGDYCNARVEDRLRLIVNNHLYSEHSLQPAYTAATFFILQNAVVRDKITLTHGLTTLNFAANRQQIALWISIPKLNAWLTLGGCTLLALGIVAAVTKPYWSRSHDPLEVITDPHVIARVLVDEEKFPPTLLNRRVVRDPTAATTEHNVEECTIRSLSFQTLQDREIVKAYETNVL